MVSKGGRFSGYDIVRGYAAFIVVFYHLYQNFYESLGLYSYFINGWKSVDLFFVLSGALLFERWYKERDYSVSKTVSSRIKRLYVPHIIVMLAYLITEVAQRILSSVGFYEASIENIDLYSFFSQLLLINIVTGDVGVWNVVTWSLSCEIILSLVLALVMFSRRLSPFIVSILAMCFALLWMSAMHGELLEIFSRAGLAFFSGCLLYFIPRIKVRDFWLYILLLFAFVFDYILNLSFFFWLITSLLVVYISRNICIENNNGLFFRFSVFLGAISYFLYLTHVYVIERFKNLEVFGVVSLSDRGEFYGVLVMILYLSVAFIMSFFLMKLSNKIHNLWAR